MFPKKFLTFVELYYAGLYDGLSHFIIGLIIMITQAAEGLHKIWDSTESKISLVESLVRIVVVVIAWKFVKGVKMVRNVVKK